MELIKSIKIKNWGMYFNNDWVKAKLLWLGTEANIQVPSIWKTW